MYKYRYMVWNLIHLNLINYYVNAIINTMVYKYLS